MSGQREWQPGDVAMVTTRYGWTGVAIRTEDPAPWCNFSGHWGERAITNARPLVVIDPEDREQVERFTHLFLSHYWSDSDAQNHTDAGQAALREFANPAPPRPDEPMGLGAVVEDGESVLWTHIGNGRWVNDQERHRSFSNVTAVRILSEGVQP